MKKQITVWRDPLSLINTSDERMRYQEWLRFEKIRIEFDGGRCQIIKNTEGRKGNIALFVNE